MNKFVFSIQRILSEPILYLTNIEQLQYIERSPFLCSR